jgi:hypothetical protein
MNKLPIAFFFLSLAPMLAATPTGHWLATQTFPDGQTRETSLWLKADGDTLTGYMSSSNQDAAPLSNGKISGSEISFSVVRRAQDRLQRNAHQRHTHIAYAGIWRPAGA